MINNNHIKEKLGFSKTDLQEFKLELPKAEHA